METLCDNCVFSGSIEKATEVLEDRDVVLCTSREMAARLFVTGVYDNRERKGMGYSRFFVKPFNESCPCYFKATKPVKESKLIHSPFNWQPFKEVNRGSA